MPNTRDPEPRARPISERAERLALALRESIDKSKGLIEDVDRLLKRSRTNHDD